MKLIYTHPSNIVVAQNHSAMEMAGLECVKRNEYAAGASGELAPIDVWPELWVVHDRDYERAMGIIKQLHAAIEQDDWPCPKCGAASPATFEFCWQCGTVQDSESVF